MYNFDKVTESAAVLAEHINEIVKHINEIVKEDCSICPAEEFCSEYGLRKGECAENLESFYEDGEEL